MQKANVAVKSYAFRRIMILLASYRMSVPPLPDDKAFHMVNDPIISVTIFQSEKEQGLFAYTADTTGGNLPVVYAPWLKLNPETGERIFRGSSRLSARANRGVVNAVQKDGYCLACNQSTFGRLGRDLMPIH